MAVGFPVKDDYVTGDVLTAANMNDLSGSVNLLQSSQYGAGRNALINGGLDFWQRGTSFTATGYCSDRFYTVIGGTTTVSQSTDVPTGVLAQYSLQGVTSASSSYSHFYQALESATVKPLQGKTVTLSVYVKTAGSYSGNFNLMANYSTSTDSWSGQSTNIFTTGFAGSAYTSWGRITETFTVPANAVGLRLQIENVSAQASGVTLRTCGWQLELGSTATTFSRAGGTIQGELAACQRYYQRFDAGGGTTAFGQGFASSTTAAYFKIPLLSAMRVTPTTFDALSLRATDYNTGFNPSGSFSIYASGTSPTAVVVGATTFTGLTQYRTYFVESAGTTSSYLGLGAEL